MSGNDDRLYNLRRYGRNSLSYLTIADDVLVFTGEWKGYIAYKTFLSTAIVLGDPITPDESLQSALRSFKEYNSSRNMSICFFCSTDRTLPALKQEGFKSIYIGKEAVIDLRSFNLNGKKRASIRSSIHHAERHNLTVEEYQYNTERSSSIETEIHAISEEWKHIRRMPELTFAFGHVDFNRYKDVRYFICRHQGRITGFISLYPIYASNSYYLDLTRRRINSPRSTIDYLIVESLKKLKEEGVNRVYIGFSPLSFIGSEDKFNSNLIRELLVLFKPLFHFFYPARSEFFFKDKFATDWEPNYICYYPRMSMNLLLSLIHILYPGGIGGLMINKIKYSLPISISKKDVYENTDTQGREES
ncbi:MAG: DUF2156 domain-containing protein [Candidatus Thermoplasmatota archaeon]